MDIRQIVIDRMTEQGLTSRQLAIKAGLSPQTLSPFLRDPAKLEGHAQTRHGRLNSDALVAVLVALDLTIVPKSKKK